MALTDAEYTTLQALIDEGVLASGVDDADPAGIRAEALIRQASRAIDRFCRSWFYDRTYGSGSELYRDGSGTTVLHLPAPIISVAKVEVDEGDTDSWVEVDIDDLHLYDSAEDWSNPKIVRRASVIWEKGPKNVRLQCHLGHLEDDGTGTDGTPIAIQRAVIRMVQHEAELISEDYGADARAIRMGRLKSKTTHNRSLSYADTITAGALTGDAIVDGALLRYRRHFA